MIRRAKISEIQHILSITNACAKLMVAQGIFQWNEHYPNLAIFKEDVERDELFVKERNGQIIGSITITSVMDVEYIPIEWLTENKKNIYIHRLCVHPDHQGKGVAREMMDFAERFAIEYGFESVRLDTFSQNNRNQKFYESRGYQKIGDVFFPKQSDHPFHCYELVL